MNNFVITTVPVSFEDSERDDAYDRIDHFLRNNLDDGNYSVYSDFLEKVYGNSSAELEKQLASSQAYAEQLREALTTCVCAMQDYQAGIGITEMFDKGERLGRKALAIPASTEALDKYAAEKMMETYIPEATINLAPGEHYAGLVIGKDGEPSYHLVLLPGQADDITWDKAMEWAGKQGGEYVASLPTRREQTLLRANLKGEFEERAYWSCEAHETEPSWAWYQYFHNGLQVDYYRDIELRARAVRRVMVSA